MGGKWQKNKPKTQPKKCDLLYVSRNQERVQRKWLKIDFLAKFLFCKENRWRNFSDFRKMEEKKSAKSAIFWHKIFNFFSKNENPKSQNGLIYWCFKIWKMSVGVRKGILVKRKESWWSTFSFSPISLRKKLFFWEIFFRRFHLFSLQIGIFKKVKKNKKNFFYFLFFLKSAFFTCFL